MLRGHPLFRTSRVRLANDAAASRDDQDADAPVTVETPSPDAAAAIPDAALPDAAI